LTEPSELNGSTAKEGEFDKAKSGIYVFESYGWGDLSHAYADECGRVSMSIEALGELMEQAGWKLVGFKNA
jgi:hypothetical protein